MIVFQVLLSFDPAKEILKIQYHIYIFMKENTSDNEDFRSTILQSFPFEP